MENNYFYSTMANLKRQAKLSRYQQDRARKKLAEYGLIEIKTEKLHCMNYYKINVDKMAELLRKTDNIGCEKLATGLLETDNVGCEKLTTNNNNKIIINKNNQSYQSGMIDGNYDSVFKSNIEYDVLVQDPSKKELVENVTAIAVDILNTTAATIRVNRENKPREVVKSRLLKLHAGHIAYVVNSLKDNTTEVKSIKNYVISALYNAPATLDVDATLWAGHAMYGDDGQ